MSNRLCNYCEFQIIKKRAKENNLVVTTKENTPDDLKEFMEGEPGTDVFVDGEWICWYMHLPDRCDC